MTSTLPQLDNSTFTSQIFWLSVTFVLLYLVNHFIFIPGLKLVMNKRIATVEENIERASVMLEETNKLRIEIKQITLKARAEICEMREIALTRAQAMISEKMAEVNRAFVEYLRSEEVVMKHQHDELEAQLPDIVKDVKDKVIAIVIDKYR